jgi:ATP-dependent helicase HrpB
MNATSAVRISYLMATDTPIIDPITLALPIYSALPALRQRLQDQPTVILQAPPGTGKSTVIPIELMREEWLSGRKIIMLEPRRLAARAVATRMASLLGEAIGKRVGYRVRFDTKVSRDTQIEIVTEGILTRMLQSDNELKDAGLVIFDEFHERSLAGDLALALVRQSQSILRPDLRVLIMSATMDAAALSATLGAAAIITAEGRTYPITLKYLGGVPDVRRISEDTAAAVLRAVREEEGDILAFLPGTGEIRRAAVALESALPRDIRLYPLYGDLSVMEQERAILPDPTAARKIVLATSIAETSLTIEGVTTVVDSGFARVSRFDPASGLSRLVTVRVTKDAADQRAGRAGRLGPGVAYRLWNEAATVALLPARIPEILEADLAPLALDLAGWGINDPKELAWITPPPTGALSQANTLLRDLEAIDGAGITDKGQRMLLLPTHPRIAHMLIEADAERLVPLAIDVAAILEERDPLPRGSGADFAHRVDAIRKARKRQDGLPIERLAQNWSRLLRAPLEASPSAEHDVAALIAFAYPERIARRIAHGTYRLASGRTATLTDHDPLASEEWLAVAHLDGRTGVIHLAAALNPADALHRAHTRNVLEWDEQKGILIAREEQRIGEIILTTKPATLIDDAERTSVLCNAIRREGLRVLPWTDALEQWRARLQSLHIWRSGTGPVQWPDVSDEILLATLEEWLGPYLSEIRKRADFQKLDLSSILRSLLDWSHRQEMDRLAPDAIEVPSGSNIKLEYFMDGRPPVLAVRLQEVFGLTDTPRVNDGRTPVLMQLLSPGYKPVQVTQDLRSFWNTTYQEVRKELRIRYPKHSWPEDPWTAEAVRGARRRSQH